VTWKAFLAPADLSDRRELGADLLAFNGIARYLAGGEWDAEVAPTLWPTIDEWMPLTPDVAAPLLFVLDGKTVLLSGPVRTAAQQRVGTTRTVTLSGVDDYAAVFGSRIVWPQPDDLPPWTTSAYHTVTGQASSAIIELIRSHRGDLARSERQGTPLDFTDQGAGPDGTWPFRCTPLIDAVAKIGRETGLTVSMQRRLADGVLAVSVGPVRNRTNLVLDDSKLGDSSLTLAAATATTVIAGGGGQGTSRLFATAGTDVVGDARIEAFSDQRALASQPSLQLSADANRAARAASAALAGELRADVADQYRWQTDYNLGDTVTLRSAQSTWPVTVEAVTVTWNESGQRVTPMLGSTPRHALERRLRDVDDLAGRLNDLEVD
jgi:hypothetical protein